MGEDITRDYSEPPMAVTITDGTDVSSILDFRTWAGGIVEIETAWTAPSNLGFLVCDTQGGTFKPLYDENGALVEILSPNVNNAMVIPAAVFAAHFVKFWSQLAGVGVNQVGADRILTVQLKG